MGRRSRAEELVEEFGEEPKEPGRYVVAYDFTGKVVNSFWYNLNRVLGRKGGGQAIQRSVVLVHSGRCARIIAELIRGYGGEVDAFKVERELEL